jgi:hypothetical protein
MVAAWSQGSGFFTPLYHIATLWSSHDPLMTSMQDAAAGNDFHFAIGTAVLGALIHMMTGAMYGALLGLVATRLSLSPVPLGLVGLGYGALVFVGSAFVGLPLAAAVFGSGDPIRNMAEMAGWGTFFTEHLLFGLVLGLLVGLWAGARRRRSETAADRTPPVRTS